MHDNYSNIEGIGCLGVIFVAIIAYLFVPMLSFFITYIGGWVCKITFGPTLCYALNTLFNATYFEPDKLPLMAGALGWIGGYFKSINLSSLRDNLNK